MVACCMRQRLGALQIAAFGQDHIVEIGRLVQKHIDAYNVLVILEDFSLFVVVAPPFDGIACIAESDLGGLRAIQVGMSLGNVLEVVVVGHGLEFHHAHGRRRVIAFVHLFIVRVRECKQQTGAIDEPLGLP